MTKIDCPLHVNVEGFEGKVIDIYRIVVLKLKNVYARWVTKGLDYARWVTKGLSTVTHLLEGYSDV